MGPFPLAPAHSPRHGHLFQKTINRWFLYGWPPAAFTPCLDIQHLDGRPIENDNAVSLCRHSGTRTFVRECTNNWAIPLLGSTSLAGCLPPLPLQSQGSWHFHCFRFAFYSSKEQLHSITKNCWNRSWPLFHPLHQNQASSYLLTKTCFYHSQCYWTCT